MVAELVNHVRTSMPVHVDVIDAPAGIEPGRDGIANASPCGLLDVLGQDHLDQFIRGAVPQCRPNQSIQMLPGQSDRRSYATGRAEKM